MQDTLGESLKNLKWIRTREQRMSAALLVLSLVVMLNVFWFLRQPGLTLAGNASCGIVEHTHDDTCRTKVCVCSIPEQAHVHDEQCYEVHWVEAKEELRLICEQTQQPHTHSDSCYDTIVIPGTQTEVLGCGNQEQDHTHDGSCYETVETPGSEKTVLICDLDSEPHRHTDSCFAAELTPAYEERVLICDGLQEGHTHGADCYQWKVTCRQEEHVHSLDCYSNGTADTETILDWQEMFADYPYTGNLREDLVGIAKTQVGYAESALNFEVGSDGVRRGYTRYGAWYGTPYRDWSAMFVSFCLHYAGADPAQTPGNTGTAAMAELWQALDKYVPADSYIPTDGDLVFFTDNTVGIVAQVQNNTVQVIIGDADDAVCRQAVALSDASIAGWGITEAIECTGQDPPAASQPEESETGGQDPPAVSQPEESETGGQDPPAASQPEESETGGQDPPAVSQPEESETGGQDPPVVSQPEEELQQTQNSAVSEISGEALLDISNGPALFLFSGGEAVPQMRPYTLRSPRAVTDLLPYLDANGGSYFFTLLDMKNQELPKDEAGNYIAVAQTDYKLTISFSSPEGFLPGTYQYQIPNGLMVDGGEGTFVLKDGTNVGSWVVTDTGLITLVFNEHINSRTDITVSATLGIHFPEQEDPIDFDGQITVTVEKPPPQLFPTEMYKWGVQGGAAENVGTDTTKLYWTVQVVGHKDSQIPGNILSDQVLFGEWSKDHRYTQSDIAGGLTFGVSESDPVTGEYKDWHSWHVSPDDPHLIWTETGWSYKIPKTVTCQWCGELELGNDGWVYTVNYTSTPDPAGTPGTYGYENEATVDGQHAYAWTDFTHGEMSGEILKHGSFFTDAGDGVFLWDFQAIIPARNEGQKADYHWYIMDYLYLLNNETYQVGPAENDAHLATVTATYNGTTVRVPRVQDATPDDPFAWDNAWTASNNGVNYGREFNLLCRCQCNADNCQFWNGSCENYWFEQDDGTWTTNGYCQCWTPTENVTFTFTYETDDLSLVETYGGLGYQLRNVAELYYKPNPAEAGALVSSAEASVPIPGVFKKELTHDFDGYTANYRVTINESKLSLTNGEPLTVHDVMTKTLAYISGSLVITAEDANGTTTELQQGVDYTVTYDGTGNQTDGKGNEVHVLDIVILRPQPVMYVLDYDATLIMPEHVTGGIKYANSATITLWGKDITDNGVEKVYADINIAAKSYKVEMFKTSALTGEPLEGATFGLYNAQGGLITTEVTDRNGALLFQTDIVEGIILREHILYYMQELKAPPGYQLDDAKHWFCFCDEADDACLSCEALMAETGAIRIPFEQIGNIHVTNELMNYDLPATGGPGVYPFILVGVILVITPLVYGPIRKRKWERRGVG